MSIWRDKWKVKVHLWDGIVEGNDYYFPTEEKAEAFRRSIVTEKDIKACYVVKAEEVDT